MSEFDKYRKMKSRQYKLLLFADNPVHMRALHRIKRECANDYIGVWHTSVEVGQEIVHGSGKKHCHILLDLEHGRHWGALAQSLGMDDVDNWRFILHIKYSWVKGRKKAGEEVLRYREKNTLKKGFVYLVHRDDLTKDQLPQSALFGADRLLVAARREIDEYEAKSVTMSRALTYFQAWLIQQDRALTVYAVAANFNGTKYQCIFRHPLFHSLLYEHNAAIYRREHQMRSEPVQVRTKLDIQTVIDEQLDSQPGDWNPFLEQEGEIPF